MNACVVYVKTIKSSLYDSQRHANEILILYIKSSCSILLSLVMPLTIGCKTETQLYVAHQNL